jgi:hypothetical protein
MDANGARHTEPDELFAVTNRSRLLLTTFPPESLRTFVQVL